MQHGHVRSARLPTYVTARIAEKILAIGRAAAVLRHRDVPHGAVAESAFPEIEQVTMQRLEAVLMMPLFGEADLEAALAGVHEVATKRLWHLFVDEADFYGHLAVRSGREWAPVRGY